MSGLIRPARGASSFTALRLELNNRLSERLAIQSDRAGNRNRLNAVVTSATTAGGEQEHENRTTHQTGSLQAAGTHFDQ